MPTIVSFHAHPDDESLLCAGWLAQRAAADDRVVLAYATDGGAGLSDPALGADLAQHRRAEAAEAARVLGVAEVVWLGWDDSGMAHDPSDLPRRFVAEPVAAAARHLADLLDAEDADTLTGYDAAGGYGHPDHIHVHRVARAAADLAHRRPRLLEATMDRTWLVRGLRVARPVVRVLGRLTRGLTLPGDDIYSPRGPNLHRIDVRDQVPAKKAALRAHRSQAQGGLRTVAILEALPGPLARRVLGTEWMLEVR